MEQPQRIRLRLPEQDLNHLTLGSTNPKKMQEWVDALPMVNVGESSRLLYQLVQELNRLRTDGRSRFALLECIRPAVLHVERQLGKHYLGQSVVLPEKQRKIASLAQALQVHIAVGYKLVAIDTVRRAKEKDIGRIATTAIHRAITGMGEILLRGYQLYLPTPRFHWLELHQLYLLAEGHELAALEVEDRAFKRVQSSTIRDCYVRALLLATARPNQLRQQEIEMVWDATEEWCGLAQINDTRDNTDIFAFDLQIDAPPTYRKLASQHQGDGSTLRSIDAKTLSNRLKLAADSGQLPEKHADFAFPRGFTRELALHLSQAWGNLTERAFQRLAANGTIDICVGLGAMHYFLSGGVDFDVLMRGNRMQVLLENRENPFMRSRAGRMGEQIDPNDAWSQAFDAGGYRMSDELDFTHIALDKVDSRLAEHLRNQEQRIKFDSYQCSIVNSSPGGYCIEWAGDMPPHIRTGELIGLREPGAPSWSVGVIRWVKQLTGKGAQLGIELLAPKATPCGTRVVKQNGEVTEWMRTLLLPELRAIGQEATLVTPAIAFSTGYKVQVNLGGGERRVALYRQLNATAGFRQFMFRELDKPDSGTPASGSADAPAGEDFDSIWSSL
ncbi:MAG: hypothetical protein ACOY33_08715 [Pseudomonadota bacterium]